MRALKKLLGFFQHALMIPFYIVVVIYEMLGGFFSIMIFFFVIYFSMGYLDEPISAGNMENNKTSTSTSTEENW